MSSQGMGLNMGLVLFSSFLTGLPYEFTRYGFEYGIGAFFILSYQFAL